MRSGAVRLWEILFYYVQKQPSAALAKGGLNKVLDALQSPAAGYYSSSEPRDLYALYLQKGLQGRAKKFRAATKKKLSYNIDYYFDMVDKNPDSYRRR